MFADVAETTRAYGETAVGLISSAGVVHLAPTPGHPVLFQMGDKLVVLAANFEVVKLKKA